MLLHEYNSTYKVWINRHCLNPIRLDSQPPPTTTCCLTYFFPVQPGAFSIFTSFMMEFANSKESTDQTTGAQKDGPTQELDAMDQMEKLQLSDTGIESSQTQTSVESSSQYDPSKIMAGSTFPRASARKDHKPPSHTFSDCDTSSFQLRVGPNYAKTGAKAPAGPSLYEVAGME